MSYHCKRCNGKLKKKTYEKYSGYSAYCWKAHCKETIEENKKIVKEIKNDKIEVDKMSISKEVIDKLFITSIDETYLEIIDLEYYLEKTKIQLPKLYSKKEYCTIYAIKEKDLQEKYYTKYLDKLKTLTENLDDNWLPTITLNNYSAIAIAT